MLTSNHPSCLSLSISASEYYNWRRVDPFSTCVPYTEFAMATLGILKEFQEGENWTEFTERLEQYFLANDIEDNGKKRAILLTVCGSGTYSLMKNLLAPAKPTDKSFSELVTLVKNHHQPKASIIVSRFKFHTSTREPEQLISDYLAQLRKLAEPCEFGNSLEEMLRDRLVIGINNDRIQRRLLSESELNLQRAVETAQASFTAALDFQTITNNKPGQLDRPNLQKMEGKDTNVTVSDKTKKYYKSARKSECYRCLGTNHSGAECRFREATCHSCKKKGHIKRACRSKPDPDRSGQKANVVRENSEADCSEDMGEEITGTAYNMFYMCFWCYQVSPVPVWATVYFSFRSQTINEFI